MSEGVALRWQTHQSDMQALFARLQRSGDMSDVTVTNGSCNIRCHRLVLSAACPNFHNLLKSYTAEVVLYLGAVHSSILQALVEFMYHGQVHVPQQQLNDFLQLATQWGIRGLCGGDVSIVPSTGAQDGNRVTSSVAGTAGDGLPDPPAASSSHQPSASARHTQPPPQQPGTRRQRIHSGSSDSSGSDTEQRMNPSVLLRTEGSGTSSRAGNSSGSGHKTSRKTPTAGQPSRPDLCGPPSFAVVGQRRWQCPHCGRKYVKPANFKSHLFRLHRDVTSISRYRHFSPDPPPSRGRPVTLNDVPPYTLTMTERRAAAAASAGRSAGNGSGGRRRTSSAHDDMRNVGASSGVTDSRQPRGDQTPAGFHQASTQTRMPRDQVPTPNSQNKTPFPQPSINHRTSMNHQTSMDNQTSMLHDQTPHHYTTASYQQTSTPHQHTTTSRQNTEPLQHTTASHPSVGRESSLEVSHNVGQTAASRAQRQRTSGFLPSRAQKSSSAQPVSTSPASFNQQYSATCRQSADDHHTGMLLQPQSPGSASAAHRADVSASSHPAPDEDVVEVKHDVEQDLESVRDATPGEPQVTSSDHQPMIPTAAPIEPQDIKLDEDIIEVKVENEVEGVVEISPPARERASGIVASSNEAPVQTSANSSGYQQRDVTAASSRDRDSSRGRAGRQPPPRLTSPRSDDVEDRNRSTSQTHSGGGGSQRPAYSRYAPYPRLSHPGPVDRYGQPMSAPRGFHPRYWPR